ncbi:Hypothetical protein GbCGDNIH2_1523 [Granulibacter bethesdensis]|nr:Hypothetical protein GbCGDNIH2_1523 [Granulibacter bethesdensis]
MRSHYNNNFMSGIYYGRVISSPATQASLTQKRQKYAYGVFKNSLGYVRISLPFVHARRPAVCHGQSCIVESHFQPYARLVMGFMLSRQPKTKLVSYPSWLCRRTGSAITASTLWMVGGGGSRRLVRRILPRLRLAPITDSASCAAAMAAGVEYLQKQVAPAVLASAVEVGLGQLLAHDPSVTVGAAATAAAAH